MIYFLISELNLFIQNIVNSTVFRKFFLHCFFNASDILPHVFLSKAVHSLFQFNITELWDWFHSNKKFLFQFLIQSILLRKLVLGLTQCRKYGTFSDNETLSSMSDKLAREPLPRNVFRLDDSFLEISSATFQGFFFLLLSLSWLSLLYHFQRHGIFYYSKNLLNLPP